MVSSRQKAILSILEANQLTTVEALANQLEVSEATVRRDLVSLESEGLIMRTWGGAVPVERIAHEALVNERSRVSNEEKKAIAKAAIEMVEEGDIIALDVGTTCLELAKLLRAFKRITVFTNSLLAARVLGTSNLPVHIIGGRMRPDEFSLVGLLAVENVQRFYYDKFFMGASGFDLSIGPTDFNLDDVEIKQCFLKQSRQRIALVDHSKFDKTSLTMICPLEQLTHVVTGTDVSSQQLHVLKQRGLGVTVAPLS